MKSSEEVSAPPSAPWQPPTAAQPPSYAEAINSAPYPTQMPQPYPQQPIPPYPVQQPYPTAQGMPTYPTTNQEPVYQQFQTSDYTAPVVNHPTTHVQHIVTHLPTERSQSSGCGDRKGIRILLGVIFGLMIFGTIVRAVARGF